MGPFGQNHPFAQQNRPNPQQQAARGVYWRGADNNYYVKAQGFDGVQNLGTSLAPLSRDVINSLQEIDDPNPPQQRNSSPAPAAGGGGGSSTPDRSRDIRLNQAGLEALGGRTKRGIGRVDESLQRLIGQYDEDAERQTGRYEDQSTTNQQNFQRNRQTALVNAAQGRRGLFGTLASIGALSGSGVDLASRAVQQGANRDISGAQDTFGENQQGLDTAIGEFREADERRRDQAEVAAENAKLQVRNQAAERRQKFYTNMADAYAAMGDEANANKFTDLAAQEFASIADTSIPNFDLGFQSIAQTPASLSSYLAGAQDTRVSVAPKGQNGIPELIAGPARRDRERERAVA